MSQPLLEPLGYTVTQTACFSLLALGSGRQGTPFYTEDATWEQGVT